ncbi:MAG TPA: hypothetical protein VLE23_00650 [Geminicoccaceae bacterium]|nr:hypothetical protein [Geminicoccaceae bacterium]
MANFIDQEILMNSVLGKISDVILNGDGDLIPKSDDHYLAFMSPGIPMVDDDFNYALEGFTGVSRRNVDADNLEGSNGPQDGVPPVDPAELATDAMQKFMRAEAFHAMCDLTPDASGIVESGRINVWNPETRVSSVYAMALQQSQVFDVQPDDETKAKIERWRSLLQTTETKTNIVTGDQEEITRESNLVRAYNEKMMAYLGAALEYNNLRISALAGQDAEAVQRFAINANLLQMKVRAALNDWSGNGFKGEYEQLNAAIQAVEERSFALLKQRYREDFTRSLLTNPSSGANFLYTAPAPASFARSDSGWTEFKFDSGSFRSNHEFTSRQTGGAGAFSIGMFSVGGSGSVSKEKWQGKVDSESFSLSFKMCRVPIYRPWFHLDFIKSGFWRFDQSNVIVKNALISDGASPPDGLMPAITTECVFIRDLGLHFGERHSEFLRQKESVSGRGGISIGPFWAGGRHSSNSDQRSHAADWSQQGIRVPGLQLLGFICHMLPKAPDPNPGITAWI